MFDLDGTLVDSAPDIADALNRPLAGHRLPPLSLATVAAHIGEGAFVLVKRALATSGVDADAARVEADTRAYLAHYAARPCIESTLFADAATALPSLRAAGFHLAICTNKPEALSRTVLAALGILDLFAVVVGADTTARRKPDPLPLRHALAALGVEAGDALMVGDTPIDRATAIAAGVDCRIVAWAPPIAGAAILHRFADLLG